MEIYNRRKILILLNTLVLFNIYYNDIIYNIYYNDHIPS